MADEKEKKAGARFRKRPDPLCWQCLKARMERVISNGNRTLAIRCPACGLVHPGDGGLKT